jgi:hypothetical protein
MVVMGAVLLVAALACGSIPGMGGGSDESVESVEIPAEEPPEEPAEEAAEETVPPTATTAPPPTLATGNYDVVGSNPDGSVYGGVLQITRSGAIYEFFWDTGTTFLGEAIQRGDKVAVAYPSDVCQIALYDVSPDGTLEGEWVNYEGTDLGSEVAVPDGGGGGIAGTYSYTGTLPDGSDYEGTMTITAAGDLYEVVQNQVDFEGGPLYSVGIARGQSLAMSYGPEGTCGVVIYTLEPDGSLDGLWGTFGVSTAAGTETATPQ